MTVPTQNVKTDTSRLMCAKHPEKALPPSRVRDGKRTGCGRCMTEGPRRKIVLRRYRAANRECLAAKKKEWRDSPRGQTYAYARLQRERNLRELEWLASDLTARVPQFTHLG